MYLLGLWDCPLFLSVGFFKNYPQADGMVSIRPLLSPFPEISYSYVEFTFYVFRNLYGRVNTEIHINFLLSSILDR